MTYLHNENCKDKIPEIKINQSTVNMLDQLPFPYVIRDMESRAIYANDALAELYGVKSKSDIMGKLDIDLDSLVLRFDESLQEFDRQYKKVSHTEKAFSTLEIHPEACDSPYIFHKKPYYDNNGICVGMFGYNLELDVYTLSDYVKGNMPGSLLLNKPDHFFTERNCEVMFFRLQGLTNKETAARLNLSFRTVENYMQVLYEKVGVNHFDDFMEFCVSRDYHRYLPRRFIHKDHLRF